MAQVVTTFVRYSPTYKKFKPIVCTGLTISFFLKPKKMPGPCSREKMQLVTYLKSEKMAKFMNKWIIFITFHHM